MFVSITATLFVTLDVILSALQLRDALPVALSVYFQLIALISMQSYRIEFSNFDVYREGRLAT